MLTHECPGVQAGAVVALEVLLAAAASAFVKRADVCNKAAGGQAGSQAQDLKAATT